MNILRQAMTSANRIEAGHDIPARAAAVVDKFNSTVGIDPQAKQDILTLLDASVELANSMLDPTYPGEVIMRLVTNILSASQRILTHTETHRPDRRAYSAMLPDGTLLPFIADSAEEAELQLFRLKKLGVDEEALVIPVRIASSYVKQPRRIEPPREPVSHPLPRPGSLVEMINDPRQGGAPGGAGIIPPSGVIPTPGVAGHAGAQSGPSAPPKPSMPTAGGWPGTQVPPPANEDNS